ncbi:MAG: DUF624 domain-containing protein [Eubacteriales bacterium]
MGKIFDLDSPIMVFLSRIADLIILNLIALVCSIPIVTIGASWTAVHYVTLKMTKNEDGYVMQSFWKSFKQNFKQATILWLLVMCVIGVIIGDFVILLYADVAIPTVVKVLIMAVSVFVLIACMYIFPVLSHFENTIKGTIKNSFLMSIINLPWTVLMVIIYCSPVIILFFSTAAIPIIFLIGGSGPAYLASLCWKKIFKKLDPEENETTDEYEELEIFKQVD